MALIFNLPEKEYRERKAISSTDLRTLAMRNERAVLLSKEEPEEESESLLFGSAFHMAILEPERFREVYVSEPSALPDGRVAGVGPGKINRNTTEWKNFIGEWREHNADKLHLDPEDHRIIHEMMVAVYQHPEIPSVLKESKTEVSVFWKSPSGHDCKARGDVVGPAYLDFKSTKCRTPGEFMNDCYRKFVHVQYGFYDWGFAENGHKFKEHFLVGVTKDKYRREQDAFLCPVDPNLLQRGYERARRLLDRIEECRVKGEWPGFINRYPWTIPSWDIIDMGENP